MIKSDGEYMKLSEALQKERLRCAELERLLDIARSKGLVIDQNNLPSEEIVGANSRP